METNRLKIWKNGRIVFYYNHADANFWDAEWENVITKEYYRKYEEGSLDEIGSFFEKYFYHDDFILEAGCGTAQYVVALLSRGFHNVEGIDWGLQTINKVKAIYPDLPIHMGDVTKIEKKDNHYDGYISLGVVEHREDGPEPYLNEAYRVLKPGGYAVVTVPYVNSLRSIKGYLGFYGKTKNILDKEFYQYAFNRKEFRSLLEKAGFDVIETHGIDGYFGLTEELPALFTLFDRIPGGWRIKQFLKRADAIQLFSHMILFVCQKRS